MAATSQRMEIPRRADFELVFELLAVVDHQADSIREEAETVRRIAHRLYYTSEREAILAGDEGRAQAKSLAELHREQLRRWRHRLADLEDEETAA